MNITRTGVNAPKRTTIEITVPDPESLNESFWETDTFVRAKAQETKDLIERGLQHGKTATKGAVDNVATFVGGHVNSGLNITGKGLQVAGKGLHYVGEGAKTGVVAGIPYVGLKYGRLIRTQLKTGQPENSGLNNLANVGIGAGQVFGLGAAALSGISYATGNSSVGTFLLGAAGVGFGTAAASGVIFGVNNAEFTPKADAKESTTKNALWTSFKNRNERFIPAATGVGAALAATAAVVRVVPDGNVLGPVVLMAPFAGALGSMVGTAVDKMLPREEA